MPRFAFTAGFSPAGGQPEAIKKLAEGVEKGRKHQVLLGVTGSGKTMVVAEMIQEIQRPTLVMSPNKTLAAQLCSEFRSFFPENSVEYFVSYYDYYQPEAYIPRTDTYIEKDSSRNDEIDRLRQSATRALLTRRDVIVVASVSCIYGVGSPEDYLGESVEIHAGEGFRRGIFRRTVTNWPYQRTLFDMEMMRETGSCAGIENYSRHLTGRRAGQEPYTLMDFLPEDTLVVVDESHVGVPQIGGMYGGDRSRKIPLVDYGFRLPSALDNRPLTFAEWERKVQQVVYVSATPGPYEEQRSQQTIEVVIRPTGLVDPTVEVRPTKGQIDDLIGEIHKRVDKKQRTLITVLTKKMAEDMTDYLREMGIKVNYLHSDVDTLERVEILRDLRLGGFDLPVGINLVPEGLDPPELALSAILDAAKDSYMHDARSLIQTTGLAARNVEGHVIMYADSVSGSMQRAIDETDRRRNIQIAYNEEHGITPASIVKAVYNLEKQQEKAIEETIATLASGLPPDEIERLIKDLERQMKKAARDLQFERAAELRDRLVALRRDAMEYRQWLPPAAAAESGMWRKPKTSRMRARVGG